MDGSGHARAPTLSRSFCPKLLKGWVEEACCRFKAIGVSGTRPTYGLCIARLGSNKALEIRMGPRVGGCARRERRVANRSVGRIGYVHGQKWIVDESEACEVLKWLKTVKLQENFTRRIADFLFSFVRDRDTRLVYETLPQANEIATNLRRHLEPEPVAFHFDHWPDSRQESCCRDSRIFLATQSLTIGRSQQEPRPSALNEVISQRFFEHRKRRNGPWKIAGVRFLLDIFLFYLLPTTNGQNRTYYPLFSNYAESEDYMAVWDGFLYGNLSSSSAELIKDGFT